MSVLNRDEIAAIVQDEMKPFLQSIQDMAECIAILTARLAKLEVAEAKKEEAKAAPKVEKKESKPQINVMGRK